MTVRSQTFEIEEDFMLPLWLKSYVGRKQWYLPAGKYPLFLEDDGLSIQFLAQAVQSRAKRAI